MLSIRPGHHWRYLTEQVGKGRHNYYTKAVEQGEPPGRWQGTGAADLGLAGQASELQMEALFGHFVNPRDPGFADRDLWDTAAKLGQPPRRFRTREQILANLLAAEPEATPERVEELHAAAQQRVRNAVAFIDATFSVQKSVSVLHTAFLARQVHAERTGDPATAALWAQRAQAVHEAIWAGNTAMLDYLQRQAGFSRTGYHGPRRPGRDSVGRYVDAHRWVAASFLQHTARPTATTGEQPHLHIHNAILNRVACPDGTWRTLDSRAIHKVRPAAAALAERVTEEHLTRSLGIQFATRPDGKAREILGVPEEVRGWFSARRRAVTDRVATYVALFTARMGRQPNPLELSRLSAKATLDTRGRKLLRPASPARRVQRWTDELRREVDHSLATIATTCLGRITNPATATQPFDPDEVITRAVHQVQATKSHWTRYDLLRAIDAQLPDCLGGLDPPQIEQIREQLADRALHPDPGPSRTGDAVQVCQLSAPDLVAPPPQLCRADGSSMYRPHGSLLYATRTQIALEEQLEAAARLPAGPPPVAPALARRLLAAINTDLAADGGQLGEDQAAALYAILTSGRPVQTLIGPAGAGKSFVVGTLAHLWENHAGGRVFGLALAQRAAQVLADEGITHTTNIAAWSAIQTRIHDGTASTGHTQRWQLRPGDLVVVDEAGMADTPILAQVQRRAHAAGATLLLVGDPHQLSAVGPGGGLRLIAEAGPTYQLTEVRRFHAAWERAASLRLRDGEVSVLPLYERHGRLLDAGTDNHAAQLAAQAWLADTLTGLQSLIIVDTNEQATGLSAQVQAELVRLGRISQPTIELADGNHTGAGDLIQARRNDRRIRTTAGTWVVNRHTYRVTATHPDGRLSVRQVLEPTTGSRPRLGAELVLPADYVAHHVTLAYATTVHGAQGQTVDTAHAIITRRTNAAAAYVALTRGRRRNTAYIPTLPEPDWRTPDTTSDTVHPDTVQHHPDEHPATPVQILADILQRHEPDRAAVHVLREELHDITSLHRLGAIWTDVQQQATTPRYEELLRTLLPAHTAEQVITDDAAGPLWRLLRAAELAGHQPRQLLATAISQRELVTADSIAKVLHWRITTRLGQAIVPRQDTYTARTHPGHSPLHHYAHQLAEVMDHRVHELGTIAAQNPPPWLHQHLGPVPDDPLHRWDWTTRAGRVMAYREQYAHHHDSDPIGTCPTVANPEARAAWHTAWRALGSPDTTPDEATHTPSQLHATIAAYQREQTWAPAWVGPQLQQSAHAAQHWHQHATLTAAQARTAADRRQRRQLRAQAAAYARLARDLATEHRALQHIDQTRADWYTHTAHTRVAADRARAELRRRSLPTHPAGQAHGTEQSRQVPASPASAHAQTRNTSTADHQPLDHHPVRQSADPLTEHTAVLAGRAQRLERLTEQLRQAARTRHILHQRHTTAQTQAELDQHHHDHDRDHPGGTTRQQDHSPSM